MSQFGTVLKHLRAEMGLSQEGLAGRLGSTQRHLSFLETGRSSPSRAFLARICSELSLSVGQRATLFEASGFTSPYKRRDFTSDEIVGALDMIEARVLSNWPFPAMVLDHHWTVLRSNSAADRMFMPFTQGGQEPVNLIELILSTDFRGLIVNWDEACLPFYYRLQAQSGHSDRADALFAQARQNGLFDGVQDRLKSPEEVPVFVPITMQLPNGAVVQMSSLVGRLASIQDALIEGFEIELMVPTDAASEDTMRALLGA